MNWQVLFSFRFGTLNALEILITMTTSCGQFRSTLWIGLLLLASFGCAKDDSPTDPQASVTGSVTYDGSPVPLDSLVVFYSIDKAVTGAGKVDSLGKYSLTAAQKSVGLPIGRYQVMIRPPEPPAPQPGTPEYQDAMTGKTKPAPPPKEIPVRFHTLQDSKIVRELKVGPNTFDFDLAKIEKN